MSKRADKLFFTPPTFSVSPAPQPVKLARQRPHKMRFTDRLSTPNVAVMMRSPNISPIPATSIRSLDFETPHLKAHNKGRSPIERQLEDSFNCAVLNTSAFAASPMEKSFRCPLDDHLDLKLILKEFELDHLMPLFESKTVSIAEISEMKEEDFVNMGIFKLNELDKLKKICSLVNDSQNSSY